MKIIFVEVNVYLKDVFGVMFIVKDFWMLYGMIIVVDVFVWIGLLD